GMLSELWGQGEITGTVRADIRSLLIEDDELRYADVEIKARPPTDGPGLIDRELIAQAAKQWLGVDLGAALPQHVEYTQFGVRLVVDGGNLQVLGTHGTDGRTILTVNILGREWGIIQQPDLSYTLPDLISLLRESAEDVDTDQVRSWWDWLRTSNDKGGSSPGTEPD
ncbi:MAG: hypothetical protein JSU63_17400, partial [Phycisphaerales bacterium]